MIYFSDNANLNPKTPNVLAKERRNHSKTLGREMIWLASRCRKRAIACKHQERQQHEHRRKPKHRKRRITSRSRHKLRQERQKKQCEFGVENIQQNGIQNDARIRRFFAPFRNTQGARLPA